MMGGEVFGLISILCRRRREESQTGFPGHPIKSRPIKVRDSSPRLLLGKCRQQAGDEHVKVFGFMGLFATGIKTQVIF
jgi:hypothetical protein